MLFTSHEFMLFVGITFLIYYIVPKRVQWVVLLCASYLFYFAAGTFYPAFLFTTSLTTWFAAWRMQQIADEQKTYMEAHRAELSRDARKSYNRGIKSRRRRWMLACLLLNLGILAVLKYTNFFIDNINWGLALAGSSREIDALDILLPMGISYYTFQSMGYLLDVYRGKGEAQKSFFRFALFVSFFPQLVQGPISRYSDLAQSLYEEHAWDWKRISFGLERILWGFFKKLVIADRILPAVTTIVQDPEYYSGGFVLAGMIFYSVELYADFTGGIDIAIGVAQVFGVTLTENFDRPYFSRNIAEFWRRWHITMGTWFRDYIFYPLGVSPRLNRLTIWCRHHLGKGFAKRFPVYVATLVTWFATGIWHGASWNFIVWGVLNGVVILISEECEPFYRRFHAAFPNLAENRIYTAFQILRTYFLVASLRLLDCYRSVGTAFRMFFRMFTDFRLSALTSEEFLALGVSVVDYGIVLAGTVILFVVSLAKGRGSVREQIEAAPYVVRVLCWLALLFAVILLGAYGIGYDATQFIYNQF